MKSLFFVLSCLASSWALEESGVIPCQKTSISHLQGGCNCWDHNVESGYPRLTCSNLTSLEPLENAIAYIIKVGQPLATLSIENSILTILPEGIFKNLPIRQLYLLNTRLTTLNTPNNKLFEGLEMSLEALKVTGNPFIRSWDFGRLQVLKRLLILDIEGCGIQDIWHSFVNKLPNNLKFFMITHDKIRKIKEGALTETNLLSVDLSNNLINHLPENGFPSSLDLLTLNNNHISTIPFSLFDHLPDLNILNLEDNRLTTLDYRAFNSLNGQFNKGRRIKVYVKGNPLNCCKFQWLGEWPIKELFDGRCNVGKEVMDIRYMNQNLKYVCP